MTVIAVVFDFDDTLAPDSTSRLLRRYGIEPDEFYARAEALVLQGYDPPLAYLNLLLDSTEDGQPLHGVTISDLRAFGASLDDEYFEGIPEIFESLRADAAAANDISIEFHIISSGIEHVLLGSKIVRKYFRGVHACQFSDGGRGDDIPRHIKRCVTFTEKTRYLYEINKGVTPEDSKTKPHLVNQKMDPAHRRVPFKNMVYVGDGMTDIPSFSLLGSGGGSPFGVWDPDRMDKARKNYSEFVGGGRLHGYYKAIYSDAGDLGPGISLAVGMIIGKIDLERAHKGY